MPEPTSSSALERFVAPLRDCLSCFLSYRFAKEVEPLAAKLQKFLALLEIDVATGAAYEPRPIVEKVKDRLGLNHDFVVLVISTHGESMWTRDEIGDAASRGIPVVPLVEEGTKFEGGLFGDLEYIRFAEGRVEETFMQLLEAVKFVRLRKARVGPSEGRN